MAFDIRLKRVYEKAARSDGRRVLVERLWPRGLTKEAARIDDWTKEIAPSAELRKWFSHDPAKWARFKERYWHELDKNPEAVGRIIALCKRGTVSFLFAAREIEYNNAVALKEYLQSHDG